MSLILTFILVSCSYKGNLEKQNNPKVNVNIEIMDVKKMYKKYTVHIMREYQPNDGYLPIDKYRIVDGSKFKLRLEMGKKYTIIVTPTISTNVKDSIQRKLKSPSKGPTFPAIKKTIVPSPKHDKLVFIIK